MIGYFIGPAIGVALLVTGMRLRARDRRRPPLNVGAAPGLVPDYPGMAAALPYPAVDPYPGAPSPGFDGGRPAGMDPRKRLRGTGIAVIGAAVLVFTTMGELGFQALTGKPLPSVAIGDCITTQSLAQPGRPKPVDCSLPNTMELAAFAAEDRCPDGPIDESLYIVVDVGAKATWCLVPNFTEGQCLRADTPETVYEATDCNGLHADIKVTRRVDDGVGDRCPDRAAVVRYPMPARLYCLESLRVPGIPA